MMTLDDEAIAEVACILRAEGWAGTKESLDLLLAVQSSSASVRAFVRCMEGSPSSHAIVHGLALHYPRAVFSPTTTGIALYLSNPGSEEEVACNVEFGSNSMVVRSRNNEDEDYVVEHFPLRA